MNKKRLLPTLGSILLALSCYQPMAYAGDEGSDPKSLSLTGVNVSSRIILQGAYDATTGLMHDKLLSKGVLPDEQPYGISPFTYAGEERLSSEVRNATGQDAVVDWVLLELREAAGAFDVIAQRAAVLQRDGDIVEPDDGAVVINFPSVSSGSYRLGVRHRNHQGILTGAPLTFGQTVTVVDFTHPATPVEGNHAQTTSTPFQLMRVGDINQDHALIAVGVGNDNGRILSTVLTAENNTGLNASYIVEAYDSSDLNLDGRVIYVGPGNDTGQLLFNIVTHPLNTGAAHNFIVSGTD